MAYLSLSVASCEVVLLAVTGLLPRAFYKEERGFVPAEGAPRKGVMGSDGKSDSQVTENTQGDEEPTRSRHDSGLSPPHQETPAVQLLAHVAAGYSARFHPAALLRKQVRTRPGCSAALSRGVWPVPASQAEELQRPRPRGSGGGGSGFLTPWPCAPAQAPGVAPALGLSELWVPHAAAAVMVASISSDGSYTEQVTPDSALESCPYCCR